MKFTKIITIIAILVLAFLVYGVIRGILRRGGDGAATEPSATSLDDIPALLTGYNVPGASIAIIKDFKVDQLLVYGVRDRDTNQPVTEETLFQAASISKSLTSVASAFYVQDGSLSPDEDINRVLTSWQVPENSFTAHEKVTLRRLLSHTAGTTVPGFDGYQEGEALPSLVQILNGEAPANSEPIVVDQNPGEAFKYSGGGYIIVQQALMDLAHEPFTQILQETVLNPLDMGDSTFYQPLPAARTGNASAGHKADGKVLPGKYNTYPELAAAGLWTTPRDLARFLIEMQLSLNGRSNKILSQEIVKEILAPVGDPGYGLGFRIWPQGDIQYFGHDGENQGFVAFMQADTETGVGAVVMTNSDNGTALVKRIMQIIEKQMGWPGY
jgi:CubicO group peptidase (beta-lactamase class C family)